jgi:hypothetical protein
MTIGFLYKESMHWVSQIQAIRNDLERVNAELKIMQPNKAVYEERKRFMKEIHKFGQTLDAVEATLLASLNNGTTYWAGHNHTYDTPRIDPCENKLFDRIKYIYNTYIDLQKSITRFLSDQMVSCQI